MKKLSALTLAVVVFLVSGCSADHSGDVQAPVPVTKAATSPTNPIDSNPNIPDNVKEQLKKSTGVPQSAPPATGK